jgi:2-polyprenyl-6-methoxyphenol hydroxylase-like FAD-dependent oxidoreductase
MAQVAAPERDCRVLIIGGGIGGMAATLALSRVGAQVELIDRDPDWRVYGTGLTITGPTLRAFRALGLLEAIAQDGFFMRGQRIFSFDGTPITEQAVVPMEAGLPTAGGIMRPKLHQILSSAVRKSGVDVRLGLTADRFEDVPSGVQVTFSDGAQRLYDLVVAADGIYSSTRQRLFPDAIAPVYSGQMSWRVVVPRRAEDALFFFGNRVICGIIPCSKAESYCFVLEPEAEGVRIAEAHHVEYLRNLIAPHGGAMAEIREGLGPASSIVQRPFEYALQPSPWYRRRVVLIGDAAHSTTAHLASGAGIAVEDALVLAEELQRSRGVIETALPAFMQRRFERCRFAVETRVAIGRMQLSQAPPEQIGMLMGKAMQRLAEPI